MSAILDYDTGPLNWVRGDIDAALQAALGRIQAYSVDADLTNAMRLAHDDAHQATGALRMVGLEGAATLASALESCLGDINENRLQSSDEVLRALRNAIEGLQRWVKDLADGRGSGELALFPLYKRLRELQGVERVFEGELFFPDLRTRVQAKAANDSLTQEALAAEVKTARGQFQRGLLAFLRNTEADKGLKDMRDALAVIEGIAPSQATRTFWWACVGFIDSLIAHGVEADFHVKQLLARVDLQMRRLIEGSPQVAERLLRDALFFVAKSQALNGRAAEVRQTLGLDRYLPGRGLLDPEALARMHPVLDAMRSGLKSAQDHWHTYVEGNAGQLEVFQTELGHMQPQAQLLLDSGLTALLNVLHSAAGATTHQQGEAREQMNLEVAATLLFMQNAIDQEDVLHNDFSARAASQQARLQALIEGREMPASVMEDTNQREAERNMLMHMALEVGQNLKQMEEALDHFFRNAEEREGLKLLPDLSQQAQGALTMLEVPEAASLLAAATAEAMPYATEGHPDSPAQQRLADAFSSLGLFIESYCAGRADAVRILRPVLIDFGVIAADSGDNGLFDDTVEAGLPARKSDVQTAYLGWRDFPEDATKKKFLDLLTELGRDAELIADSDLIQLTGAIKLDSTPVAEATPALDADIVRLTGLALPPRPAPELVSQVDTPLESATHVQETAPQVGAQVEYAHPVKPVEADVAPTESATVPALSEAAPELLLAAIPADADPELLEIFLEEAVEVLETMDSACAVCESAPDDQESLTVIRRAFHTLKGSGRMVGLVDLGETAWRHEQLMNTWLAEHKPANADLLNLLASARTLFQTWVSTLRAQQTIALPVPALLANIDRVAQGQPLAAMPAEPVALEASPVVTPSEAPAAVMQEDDEALIESVWLDQEIDSPASPAAPVFETFAESGSEWQLAESVSDISIPDPIELESTLSFDAVIDTPPLEATGEAQDELLAGPDMAETVTGPADAPVLEVGALIEYAAAPVADSLEETESLAPEEICIGTVCLSVGLHEIFMTEAHQRLAVLQEEIERHTDAPGSTVSEQAVRSIHTLAGIAGTAGIAPLSELSHALEVYWNRFSHHPLPAAQLTLVSDTVARLHAMLVTIVERQLPETANDLVAALGELGDEVAPPVATPVIESASEIQLEAPVAEMVTMPDLLPEMPVAAPDLSADMSTLIAEARPAAPAPVFDRRDVADEIDQQLLPIFLEEAETLVPDTSAQLRAWKEAPDNTAARDALSRHLHTIKGSARMVGAMRLGELTHVMESRVIAVAEGHLAGSREVFDTLEAQLDRLAGAVERLKQGDLTPEPQAVNTDDPVEAVQANIVEPIPAPIGPVPATSTAQGDTTAAGQAVSREANALTLRVRADWVDRMVNQAGEMAIARSRIESEVFAFKRHVGELSDALHRLRGHIREVEIQAESQMQATFQTQGATEQFDPLEFDRFTRFQEVTRFLAESVNDISTVQHILLARLGEADAALIQQTRLNRELQQNLLRVRMVPMYSVAERLYRTVRQTARDVDKRAQLDIQGGDLEIDRSVLEKVTAPLEHLLRNALAHGIETPEVRAAAGKPEFGEIVLSARQSGNEMLLTVKDDGAGLNFARIREKAEAQGLLLAGVEPTESLLAQMIFAAGFSTADAVSQVAGRGVGMDVVKSEISALGGRIDIHSVAGQGTTFSIYLPLTLAMTQAVMIQAGKHDYALPAPLVQQVLELKPHELEQAMLSGELSWRGTSYPFSYLPHLLGDAEAVHEIQRYNPVVLLKSGSSQAAILVDLIEGTREIVVKNIGPQMARITGVAGATVRGDGRVILILNPVPLALRWASQPRSAVERSAPAESVEVSAALQAPMVLVVDDSLTVRKITTRLLTREGFRVDSAKDGVDALERMNDLIPDVVLLDVEMPRMDGFELARLMRADARLKTVPIIMITSRTADKHRNHAMEIGVNVYLGKPYQEQQLLDNIAEQLGREIAQPA